MQVADFDQWRKDYNRLTYADQLEFYNRVAVDHPLQHGFDSEAFNSFFDAVTLPEIAVLEFGGWKGELAAEMLAKFPHIARWVNLEISALALIETVCRDSRYQAVISSCFAWERERLPECNVFVSSHTIEHVKAAELKRLLGKLPKTVSFIGLQAPLADSATDWNGYYGSHILEVGWSQIRLMLQELDFAEFTAQNEFRGYILSVPKRYRE